MAHGGARSELAIVTLFRSRIRVLAPAVSVVAIPNASKRTRWQAQQAKREGMATGFPDLVCLAPGGLVAFIEFKAEKGRLSENQCEWLLRLNEMGFACSVQRDPDEALEWLRGLGFPFIGRLAA